MTAKAKVLILEDQMMLAFEMKGMLTRLGADVVGPFVDIETALAAINTQDVDMALLDINLGDGNTSFPVADALKAKGKPFAFVTGYGSAGVIPDRFQTVETVAKPVAPAQIEWLVEDVLPKGLAGSGA